MAALTEDEVIDRISNPEHSPVEVEDSTPTSSKIDSKEEQGPLKVGDVNAKRQEVGMNDARDEQRLTKKMDASRDEAPDEPLVSENVAGAEKATSIQHQQLDVKEEREPIEDED